jgi:hypothetical protein
MSEGENMVTDLQLSVTIDPNRPTAARIYDCFLGGTHNFAADRAVAARAIELIPEIPQIARLNRAFVLRAVRHASAQGIRQFLDLGAGIPAAINVHEAAPGARVVYVDRDLTAVLHTREAFGTDPRVAVLHADLTDPGRILADPVVPALIDFDEPVCLLLAAVLHFVPDSPALTAALARYRELAAPGSVLVVSHATGSARTEELDRMADLFSRTATPLVLRDAHGLATLLSGWQIDAPGIVLGPDWRPDPGDQPVENPAAYLTLAGVARKGLA